MTIFFARRRAGPNSAPDHLAKARVCRLGVRARVPAHRDREADPFGLGAARVSVPDSMHASRAPTKASIRRPEPDVPDSSAMTAPLAPIAHDVSLRCRCGRVELRVHDVSPKVASRVICHCDGCTRFAERMDRSVLDEHGGTERFNVSPACLEFASGIDALGCIQQSSKGALRWVATCCDTPLGLTLPSARMPFVGLDVARLDQRALPVELTELIGPLRARVNGHFDR